MEWSEWGLTGLFISALTSATILPGSSEVVFSAMAAVKAWPPMILLAVASTGNVLGSCINWLIGKQAHQFENKSWFPATPEQMARGRSWYRRVGHWSLLASWAPVIGDPLTLVAGVMREPFWRFLALVTLAKTGRYAVLLAAVHAIF